MKLHKQLMYEKTELTKELPSGSFLGAEMIPLSTIPAGQWNHIAGWLSNQKILFVTDVENGSNLYTYDLYSGKSDLLIEMDQPIADVVISPSGKYILVHTSPTTYAGNITVIDENGTTLLEKEIASFELAFQWNIFNEDEIFVSSFNEDWSFDGFIVDLKQEEMITVPLTAPFPQWIAEDVVAFLQWDIEEPSLTAPLISFHLKDKNKQTLSSQVIDFASFQDYLLMINVDKSEENKADYTFLNKKQQKSLSFQVPLLTRFSGWLIPFHDFDEQTQTFYTFRPLRSADADMYGDKFQLVAYDLKNNQETILLEQLDNEPITLSPNGENLLYGYQFENIIHLPSKKLLTIVK